MAVPSLTRSVAVDLEVLGFGDMGAMGIRGGFVARTTINRQDFGVTYPGRKDDLIQDKVVMTVKLVAKSAS